MAGHMPQDMSVYRNWTVDTNPIKMTVPSSLPQRPSKLNQFGKETTITLNTFNVHTSLSSIVNQYDVSPPSIA
jgi:eukaryotic translation initiation factor 2C